MQQDEIGVSVGLVDDDNLFIWTVIFEGPEDTLYEVWKTAHNVVGRLLQSDIKVPSGLPQQPSRNAFRN